MSNQIKQTEYMYDLLYTLKNLGLCMMQIRVDAIKKMERKQESLEMKFLGGVLNVTYTFDGRNNIGQYDD